MPFTALQSVSAVDSHVTSTSSSEITYSHSPPETYLGVDEAGNAMALKQSLVLFGHRTTSTIKFAIPALRRRTLATAVSSQDASSLPLAGIKVLDMTRVLAGVLLSCSVRQET